MNEPVKPKGFESVLGKHAVLYKDSTCGEPIMWGWHITQPLGEEAFKALQAAASVVCLGKAAPAGEGAKAEGAKTGIWAVVSHRLTPALAAAKYGAVTAEVHGPKGGWKSTTYGVTTFTSRVMNPTKNLKPKSKG